MPQVRLLKEFQMKSRIAIFAAVASVLPISGQAQEALQEAGAAYVLGPQDGLSIRVNSLRRDTGEIYTWGPLSGDFSVGADGTIFLPIIGQLSASGSTPEALAVMISEAMRKAANLVEVPSTTVEVISYRPIFVMGAVQRPGSYAFQPSMSVLQALSMAEGFIRSPDMAATQREAIAAAGDVQELTAEYITLQARMARFVAEKDGGEVDLVVPTELAVRMNEDPRIETALLHAKEQYEAGRAALEAEIKAIEDAKALLQRELLSLDQKDEALARQQELYDEELTVSTNLLERGLAVSSRQIAAENARLTIGNNLLDVQLAKLRAQQALQAAERDAINLRARYRTEALAKLVETREQIDRNRDKLQMAQALLTLAMSRSVET
ncbi:MAG: polysaccharide biosynthesis/export family protein, partial [Paracoccaceae bacterium]